MSLHHRILLGIGAAALPLALLAPAVSALPAFSLKWGTPGTADGQFDTPTGIAVDAAGNVFVADRNNNRIQKFSNTGTFLLSWGTGGTGNGQFDSPRGIAVDKGGDVYVADYNNARVQRFTGNGVYVLQWGTAGSGDGQFQGPRAITLDAAGYVYVTEDGFVTKRVQKFTRDGAFVLKWGSFGTGNGQFQSPRGIAAEDSSYIYVTDTYTYRVEKFTSAGAFLGSWGQQGTADGDLDYPSGCAWTGSSLLVVDSNNNRIQEFDSSGAFLGAMGSLCDLATTTGCIDPDAGGPLDSGDGQFNHPLGVAQDSGGNVFVTDTENNRVEKFGSSAQVGIGDTGAGFIGTLGAYPNPMRGATRIVIHLEPASGSSPAGRRAEAAVFDLAGRPVRNLFSGPLSREETVLEWDGRSDDGAAAPPGIYFLRARVDGSPAATLKLVRLP